MNWFKALLGFPPEASGLLVSGGSMANLIGLAVARNVKAGFDLRKEGLAAAPRPLVFYASEETHSSNIKAAELLGLGSSALRLIPVNDAYEIDLAALQAAITADWTAGLQPFAIIGHAGTVNTGAIDDLTALADLAEREGLWFHVDGAFGALAALAPGLRDRVAGMERADLLAFDLHKWIGVPIEAGCVLVRREADHRKAFATTAAYLTHGDRGAASGSVWFGEYGPQLSRGFRALKVWMAMQTHGVSAYRQVIQQNVDQAVYLSARIDAEPELELLAPTALNLVCFRYNPGGLDDDRLNALNQEVLIRLQERGIAVPSSTRAARALRDPGRQRQPPQPPRGLRRAGRRRDRPGPRAGRRGVGTTGRSSAAAPNAQSKTKPGPSHMRRAGLFISRWPLLRPDGVVPRPYGNRARPSRKAWKAGLGWASAVYSPRLHRYSRKRGASVP